MISSGGCGASGPSSTRTGEQGEFTEGEGNMIDYVYSDRDLLAKGAYGRGAGGGAGRRPARSRDPRTPRRARPPPTPTGKRWKQTWKTQVYTLAGRAGRPAVVGEARQRSPAKPHLAQPPRRLREAPTLTWTKSWFSPSLSFRGRSPIDGAHKLRARESLTSSMAGYLRRIAFRSAKRPATWTWQRFLD